MYRRQKLNSSILEQYKASDEEAITKEEAMSKWSRCGDGATYLRWFGLVQLDETMNTMILHIYSEAFVIRREHLRRKSHHL